MDHEAASIKQHSLNVLRALRKNLFGTHSLRGKGRENSKAVDEVCKALGGWIIVRDIQTKRSGTYCEITVTFERSFDFKEKFLEKK